MAYSLSNIDRAIGCIRDNTRSGVDNIEDYAQRNAKREPEDEYERALLDKSNKLEHSVHQQVDDIRDSVLSRRPNQTDPNYSLKKQQYMNYVQHATTGMTSLKGGIESLFLKVVDVVKRVVKFVRENFVGFFNFINNAFKVLVPILSLFGVNVPYC